MISTFPCNTDSSGSFLRKMISSRPVLILHDAIWVEAPKEEAVEARIMLERAMKDAVELSLVPLEVDFG